MKTSTNLLVVVCATALTAPEPKVTLTREIYPIDTQYDVGRGVDGAGGAGDGGAVASGRSAPRL